MPLLAVNPLANNSVQYTANFTSVAPITIMVGVDSPGLYSFGQTIHVNETGIVTNSTGSFWTAFDIALIGAPSGSSIAGAGSAGPNQELFEISSFASNVVHYVGTPGLPSGASFEPGVDYVIGGTGPQVFSVQFIPIPEPTSAVLLTLEPGRSGGGGVSSGAGVRPETAWCRATPLTDSIVS